MKKNPALLLTTPTHDAVFQKLKALVLEACGQISVTEMIAIMSQMSGIITLAEEDALSQDWWEDVIKTNFTMGMLQGIEIGST